MAPQPRWTIPVNIRQQDKPILDAAFVIAKTEGINITNVFRNALTEYVRVRQKASKHGASERMDNYLGLSSFGLVVHSNLLTPEDLRQWTDADVLTVAKQVRARKQELESELRRRGYYFRW